MAAYHAAAAELSSCDRDCQAYKVYLGRHRKGLPTPALERKGNERRKEGGREGGKRRETEYGCIPNIYCKKEEFDFFSMAQDIIKKAERQRIDAFELWCWTGHLRVPRTARRSNQSILKEINPESSLEGLILKIKLQYFGHLIQRVNSLEKTLMLGKIEGIRIRRH